MELSIDDKLLDDSAVDGDTVEEALEQIQQAYCPADRLVIGLRLDGRAVGANAMAEALNRPLASLTSLEVRTGTRSELVTDAMTQAAACLQETESSCQEAAGLLTEGRAPEAAAMLGDCFRVWQQVHDAVSKSIEMLLIDPQRMTVDGVPLPEMIARPTQILIQIREALQVRDHVLLADILQYEFQEVTQGWQMLIAELRREADRIVPRPGDGSLMS